MCFIISLLLTTNSFPASLIAQRVRYKTEVTRIPRAVVCEATVWRGVTSRRSKTKERIAGMMEDVSPTVQAVTRRPQTDVISLPLAALTGAIALPRQVCQQGSTLPR